VRANRSTRLSGIDGVRALAATSVLVYHVWLYSYLGEDGSGGVDLGATTKLFDSMRAGVTLFFVLSGFLLFRPYVASALRGKPWPSTRTYLRNRALRILPAYWFILLAVAVLFQHGLLTDPGKLAANLGFVRTYIPSYDDWSGTVYAGLGLGPAWSLMIEVVFYLCLPVVSIYGMGRLLRARVPARLAVWLPVVVLASIGLVGQIVEHLVPAGRSYRESFLPYAGLFAPGMALAILRVRWENGDLPLPRRWRIGAVVGAATLGLVATRLYYGATLTNTETQWVISIAFAILLAVVVFAEPGSRVVSCLEWKPLAALGLASYSVFLWHDPIVHSLQENGLTLPGRDGFFVNLAFISLLTIVASTATYLLVERPALARKKSSVSGNSGGADSASAGASAAGRYARPLARIRRGERVATADWLPEREIRVRPKTFLARSRAEAVVAGLGPDVRESIKVEGDSPSAFADPTAFDRILEILLQNALEYGAKPVTVRTNQRDGVLSVAVEDHGRGVDPRFVPRLFEPFARSEQSRHVREGSGLGLATAEAYATAQGGSLRYEPIEPHGARFVLELPVTRDRRRRSIVRPKHLATYERHGLA
jgi:peptidoglycan/LPS O-acetylase OafA/YrhL